MRPIDLRVPGAALLAGALLACSGSDDAPASAKAGNVYAEGWSAVHADAANSDYSPVRGARDLTLAWSRSFVGNINLGATSDPLGQVYVALNTPLGCHLYALDAATGDTVWCSDEVDRFASISSPLIDRDGHLYLADSEAMHAFDRSGRLLWEAPIVGVPLSAQFTAEGNLVFITHIGRIYLLRREDGAQIVPPLETIPGATYRSGENVLACATGRKECPSANTPAIDLATGRFIFTLWAPDAESSGIRAVQVREGAEPALTPLWTNDSLPGGSASSPALSADGARIYVTDNDGGLHALDTATGATVWSVAIGYNAAGSASCSPEGLVMPAGGLLAPLMAVADRGDTGVLLWQNDDVINGGIATQAAGDVAYVTDFSLINDLIVVDTRSGEVLDREPLRGVSGFTVGTTVGVDGTVYVASILGQLFAFRPAVESSP